MNQEKDETVSMEEEVRIIKNFLIIKTKTKLLNVFLFYYII